MDAPDGIFSTNEAYTPAHTLATPKPAANHNTCLKVRDTNNAPTGGIISSAEIKKIPTTLNDKTTATEVINTRAVLTSWVGIPRVWAKASSKHVVTSKR